MSKRRLCWLLGLVLAVPAARAVESNALYQVSTISALLEGVYDGATPCAELLRHGDFGIGTLDGLNGELIIHQGRAVLAASDGQVYPVAATNTIPFAVITFFRPQTCRTLENVASAADLQARLGAGLASNYFYAICVTGRFECVKVRSVPRQHKPYPRLADVVRRQSIFEYRAESGVLMGFWTPVYANGIGVAGFHLHFLSADGSKGGHLLNCRFARAEAQSARVANFTLHLPAAAGFSAATLDGDRATEIHTVEQ